MSVESLFLGSSVASFRQHTQRIGSCLGKLTDDQIWSRGHENENSIGNLILHLCGNVRQWIIGGLGGQPDIRQRDLEFSTEGGITAAELAARLEAIVAEATAVISGLTREQLEQAYTIQNNNTTGVAAVFRVTEHFAQHTGQIIFVTKHLTGEEMGFTIPRTRTAAS